VHFVAEVRDLRADFVDFLPGCMHLHRNDHRQPLWWVKDWDLKFFIS
jgi:hypothetical protein